jgi:hypothetical protein
MNIYKLIIMIIPNTSAAITTICNITIHHNFHEAKQCNFDKYRRSLARAKPHPTLLISLKANIVSNEGNNLAIVIVLDGHD